VAEQDSIGRWLEAHAHPLELLPSQPQNSAMGPAQKNESVSTVPFGPTRFQELPASFPQASSYQLR
jgi:hypothetical protein